MQHEIETSRRHLFGFANGIYNVLSDRFHEFSDDSANQATIADCEQCIGRFNRYTPVAQHFGSSEHMKYSDVYWKHISDPVLDPVIEYQRLSEDQEWHLWASIGRLLYDVNTTDSWERTLVISGRSPCGLGVLMRRVASIYPRERITVPVFQNSHVCSVMAQTAYIGMLDEITLPQIDESQFVRMTSGEPICDAFVSHGATSAERVTNTKSTLGFGSASSSSVLSAFSSSACNRSKPACLEEEMKATTSLPFLPSSWRAPLIVASHTLPDWMHPDHHDSSWRTIRRLTYIPFKRRVESNVIDPLLLRSAAHNVAIGNFLLKANRAYRQLLASSEKRQIYDVVNISDNNTDDEEDQCYMHNQSLDVCPIPGLVESSRRLDQLRRKQDNAKSRKSKLNDQK